MSATPRVRFHHGGGSAVGRLSPPNDSETWTLIRRRADVLARMAVARRWVKPQDAEDLKQDLYLAIHRRISRLFLRPISLESFVNLLLAHALIDRQRFHRALKRRPRTRHVSIHDIDVDHDQRRSQSIDRQAQCELTIDLATALNRLTPIDRQLLCDLAASTPFAVAKRRRRAASTIRHQLKAIQSLVQPLLRSP